MERRQKKAPEVYNIPPDVPFLERLMDGVMLRGTRPENLARLRIFLPTRRAARKLEEILVSRARGRAALLPRIGVIGDIDELDLAQSDVTTGLYPDSDIAPAMPEAERLFLLARQVHHWYAATRRRQANWPEALAMARQLAEFIDAVEIEELNLADLASLAPAEYAAHWGEVLSFLEIVTNHWPRILGERGMIDASRRRSMLIRAVAKTWRKEPPNIPIIAAGSTGSVKATAELLSVVARLPQGQVVLPGLDVDLDDESWQSLEPGHPQFQLRELLRSMRVDRTEVTNWPTADNSEPSSAKRRARLRYVNEALRPAATLPGWRHLKFDAEAISKGVSRIDCPGLQQEAGTIALIMRETLETPDRTAALITRNRELARRVVGELGRWDIKVEDSAGLQLLRSPAAVFLSLLADAAHAQFAPVALLALLKHPLAAQGAGRRDWLRQVRRLEVDILRGRRFQPGIGKLITAAKRRKADDLADFMESLRSRLEPFVEIMQQRKAEIFELLDAHYSAAIALNRWEGRDEPHLLEGAAGELLTEIREKVGGAVSVLPPLPTRDYPVVFKTLLEGEVVREPQNTHPRLYIWGTLEARLQSADRIILGGMNEGSWPPEDPPDPWLSRPMRRRFGLSDRDKRRGQSAHDFVSALGAEDVIITRAEKIDGTPTAPSRWLTRLEALGVLRPGGDRPWLAWQASQDSVSDVRPAAPPAPRPPDSARPRDYWVSDIDLLLRDPYAFYARRILDLRPLDPVDPEPDAAERGILIHRVLEKFVRKHPNALDDNALDELLKLGRSELRTVLGKPRLASFWWPRFERAARKFFDYQKRIVKDRHPIGLEIAGAMELKTPRGAVTIHAKADRLDQLAARPSIVVLDYKTGSLPTRKQVHTGLAPQLPLEGAIAAAGGFKNITAAAVESYEYWPVTAKPGPMKVLSISDAKGTLFRQTCDGVIALLANYLDSGTPYLAQPRPWIKSYGEYHHLARLAEWRRAGNAPKVAPE